MLLCFQFRLDGGLWGCGFQEITSVNRDDHICNCMFHHCHAYFWMLKLCGCAGINCRAIHFHATALAAAAVAGSTKVVCLSVKKNTHWKKFLEFLYELIRFLYQFEDSLLENKHKQTKPSKNLTPWHHNMLQNRTIIQLTNGREDNSVSVLTPFESSLSQHPSLQLCQPPRSL